MRIRDTAYFIGLALSVAAFVGLSLSHAFLSEEAPPSIQSVEGSPQQEGAYMDEIRQRIKSGILSDHEAEFYHPMEARPPEIDEN